MIRLLYNLLFPIGLLLFLPAYLLKMRRRGNYRESFGQRFGFYSGNVRERLQRHPHSWIHAVSVGEVAIGLKLAAKLRELDPSFHCVLTTTTTTGFAVARKEAPPWMEVMYNPLDFWPVVQRAFALIRPTRLILVEAEVWPNLAAAARARRVPLALVNARLSARSEARFGQFLPFVAPTFGCLDLVCVQEGRDVARWENLGVARTRIAEVGSIKYDPTEAQSDATVPRESLRRFGIDPATQPILFGGSTHDGEEGILAKIFLQLREKFPSLVLLIAPRHVERTREIRAQLETLGLRVALRSEVDQADARSPDCLLLDTTGELRDWYHVGTVVFIGKSLTANGGQNPVEAILAGKPVIFGPHMENFASLARSLLEVEGAVEARDPSSLALSLAALLGDRERREQLVTNAQRVLMHHQGATHRTAALLLPLQSQSARVS